MTSMLISETGRQRLRRWPRRADRCERGLTLIEVLLVVFLVGLGATMVIMTLPTRPSADVETVEQLASDLDRMRRDAIYSGQPVGIRFDGAGYSTSRWLDGRWGPRHRSEPLSYGQSFQFVGTQKEPPSDAWPDYIFDPTGVGAVGQIDYSGTRADYRIHIDVNGEVRIDRL